MNDEEIIEALDLCTQQNGSIPCYDCPCWNYGEQKCEGIDYTATLDLINRQKAEIERLEKLLNGRDQLVNALNKCYKQAKSEAIKEFAKRLKGELNKDFRIYGNCTIYDFVKHTDNLVKEMTEVNEK